MSTYRDYPPSEPLLFGYDPERDIPDDHLCRLIDIAVEEGFAREVRAPGKGQPPFDPRLPIKVLLYGYAIGVRSSRQLARLCKEHLAFLFLTRGDGPSYRVLCTARIQYAADMHDIWLNLFLFCDKAGLHRIGKITVDTTKLRANASPEAILKSDEYEAFKQQLVQALAEAEATDTREEDAEGGGVPTVLPKADHMRDILRRVREERRREAAAAKPADPEKKPSPEGTAPQPGELPQAPGPAADREENSPAPANPEDRKWNLSEKMCAVLRATVAAIEQAQADGRKHLCLTDPDARMMAEGRSHNLRECHAFEVAIDNGCGLIVASGITTDSDNSRLMPLVERAREVEPGGVTAVDGDSGFWRGDTIAELESHGVNTCIPDSFTACDLHRGLPVGNTLARLPGGNVPFAYDPESDTFTCPEGNLLKFQKERLKYGQRVREYRAERACTGCQRASDCLRNPQAKHRTLSVGIARVLLNDILKRFDHPDHQERYRKRGAIVETLFGFLKGTLRYTHWMVRGADRVASEGKLITLACTIRKLHKVWA